LLFSLQSNLSVNPHGKIQVTYFRGKIAWPPLVSGVSTRFEFDDVTDYQYRCEPATFT
jgi:hypothetical protein